MISRGTWHKLFVLTGMVGRVLSALLWLWMAEEHYRNKRKIIISGGPFPSPRCVTHTWKERHAFLPQTLSAGVARENPFHALVCSACCFHVSQKRLMLLKHHDNLAVFGIRRFSISWACCNCWFIWQEKHWFAVMPSTSQVKQKNILIVVMCCHLYTRDAVRENLPNFLCKLSLGCSVIN